MRSLDLSGFREAQFKRLQEDGKALRESTVAKTFEHESRELSQLGRSQEGHTIDGAKADLHNNSLVSQFRQQQSQAEQKQLDEREREQQEQAHQRQIEKQHQEFEQERLSRERDMELKRLELEQQMELEREKLAAEKQQLEQMVTNQKLQERLDVAADSSRKDEFEHKSAQQKLEQRRFELEKERAKLQMKEKRERWIRRLLIALAMVLLVALVLAAVLGLWRLYRWTVEEPLIKEVEKRVEVEKEVIPEECTQVRRNGKVYINCDGVTVEGAPTIIDSGLEQVPELLTEQ